MRQWWPALARQSFVRRVILALPGIAALAAPASAAELRIPYAELAGIVQAVLGDAKLHLHNKPGGLLSMASGSFFQIADKEFPVPLQAKSFNVLGSSYAYYADDINSQSITVSAVEHAVRLTLNFESKASALVAGCVSNDCALTAAMPQIGWRDGAVMIDVTPVQSGTSLTLQVKRVSIGGPLTPRCLGSNNVIATSACRLALSWANKTIAKLKPEIAAKMTEKVNDPETQAKVADGLKKYLTIGTAGELAITSVRSDSTSVTIAFQLAQSAGG